MSCQAAPTVCKANITPIRDPEKDQFPEIKQEIVKLSDNSVALCLSGGGSRALTCSMGYLRGLHYLGLDDKAAYVSCVSGGSWCGSLYTFLPGTKEEILGEATSPEQITKDFLREHNPGKIGTACHEFKGLATMDKLLLKRTRLIHIWQRVIGAGLLEEHGLARKIMVQTEDDINRIKELNPHIEEGFITPREGRPFLIIGGTVLGPKHYMSGWGNSLQMTPMYTGVPFYRENKKMGYLSLTCCFGLMPRLQWFRSSHRYLTVGGGVIDTFAFGSRGVINPNDQYNGGEACRMIQPKWKNYFTLEDAVGISSSAYVAEFENKGIGKRLTPRAVYWPILTKEYPKLKGRQLPITLDFGDGGNYENTGMLAALQRGVKKVICCVNTARPLDRDFVPNRFFEYKKKEGQKKPSIGDEVTYACADGSLLAFFGAWEVIDWSFNYTMNTVFEKDKLNDVMEQMIHNVNKGKGAWAKVKLKLLPNEVWSILGGYDVEVIFIYNETVQDFVDKLPQDTVEELKKGKHGYFENYPHYKTTLQNPPRLFNLTKPQINLLSSQAEHLIKINADVFKDFFGA